VVLAVVTTAGEHLGRVAQILQTGSNDVYVVRDDRREVLIPAIHDVVREIDLTAGVITVEAIEGLL
jgi:16S rRNA processing protein RimM